MTEEYSVTHLSVITVLMLCTTMFCVAENASVTGNFAHKNKAYANRQIQGVALPEKERIGQVETGSDYGAYNLRTNHRPIQL